MREWRDLVRERLIGLHLSPLREQEIVEELSLHLEQRCDELKAEGTSDDDARRLALSELSGPITIALNNQPGHEASSSSGTSPARNLLLRDAKYAIRQLVRDPVFSIVAMLS